MNPTPAAEISSITTATEIVIIKTFHHIPPDLRAHV